MDWLAPVDIYCERTDAAFWSEPLNAISNVAFLIAAAAAARWASRSGRLDFPALALAGLVAVIGVGSFLFHTFANRWSALADVVPIGLFILAYLFLSLRRFFAMHAFQAGLVTAAFFVSSQAFEAAVPRSFLNGSGGYLPAWGAMLVIGTILVTRSDTRSRLVLTAAAIFTASLTLRSLDQAMCDLIPIGLHYFWHMLNATTLYVLLLAVLFEIDTDR